MPNFLSYFTIDIITPHPCWPQVASATLTRPAPDECSIITCLDFHYKRDKDDSLPMYQSQSSEGHWFRIVWLVQLFTFKDSQKHYLFKLGGKVGSRRILKCHVLIVKSMNLHLKRLFNFNLKCLKCVQFLPETKLRPINSLILMDQLNGFLLGYITLARAIFILSPVPISSVLGKKNF